MTYNPMTDRTPDCALRQSQGLGTFFGVMSWPINKKPIDVSIYREVPIQLSACLPISRLDGCKEPKPKETTNETVLRLVTDPSESL